MAPTPPTIVHLPNGQSLSVSPVFGGLSFKANDLNTPHNVFPPGWTIIINSEDDDQDHAKDKDADASQEKHVHRFKTPTLRNDHLFISSISNPSSNDFRAPTSPTRQIAMMLWATLYWYFHQPAPARQLTTAASGSTPVDGRPRGEWRININREGIFTGRQLIPKLERMGLIASEDSSVGLDPDDGMTNANHDECWSKMFVSRRAFWQMDPRLYLFTLTPMHPNSPFPSLSPAGSRPVSPSRGGPRDEDRQSLGLTSAHRSATPPPGPFHSTSHLPTFYPPAPLQYTFTNNIRHPLRPKPFRQGETIYTRYIPSLDQYLSFRVASLSTRPVPYPGPYPHSHPASPSSSSDSTLATGRDILRTSSQETQPQSSSSHQHHNPTDKTDLEYLHKWHNSPRVAYSWGETGPLSHQKSFLEAGLKSQHSIPLIGCWDGKPFGYFEMYWVKEDRLGSYLGNSVGDFDRGLHVLVGEDEFRGSHRVKVWIDALVHACWLADSRTEVVVLEPRVDNAKLKTYLEDRGFFKEREISFPHKQSNLMKIRRDGWEGPAI